MEIDRNGKDVVNVPTCGSRMYLASALRGLVRNVFSIVARRVRGAVAILGRPFAIVVFRRLWFLGRWWKICKLIY